MVDRVSAKNQRMIEDAAGLITQSKGKVEQTNKDSATDSGMTDILGIMGDTASVSDAAKAMFEKDKEVLRFSRLAQRVEEQPNTDKVAYMKDLLDSGRINDYLRSLNTDDLAQAILDGPSGAFLR